MPTRKINKRVDPIANHDGRRVRAKKSKRFVQDSSKMTLESFSTEIIYIIYSYLCSPILNEDEGESQNGISSLVLSMGLVSKHFHQIVQLFTRQIPLKFHVDGNTRFHLPVWMIRNQCKLSSITMDCFTSLHAGLSLKALRNCDISSLTSMDLNWGMQCIALASEAEHRKAIECGLSPSFANLSTVISGTYDYHQATATLLQNRAPNLTKMRLLLVKQTFNPIILHVTASTLVELDLTLMQQIAFPQNDWVHDIRGQWVTNAIASMPRLTKLNIIVYDFAKTILKIRSDSLEEINTRSANHFFLEECICPKLKVFKCVYISHIRKMNGLMSISLMNVDELVALYLKQEQERVHKSKEDDQHAPLEQQILHCNDSMKYARTNRERQDMPQSYNDIWAIRCDNLYESPVVSLPVSEHAFFGLKAPKSCIVEVQCDEIRSRRVS